MATDRSEEVNMRAIAAERALRSMSQSDLANELGVSRLTVARWELGESTPNVETITKIADFFGVSTDYILGRSMERLPR